MTTDSSPMEPELADTIRDAHAFIDAASRDDALAMRIVHMQADQVALTLALGNLCVALLSKIDEHDPGYSDRWFRGARQYLADK